MRRLTITLLLLVLVAGCGTIKDALNPDIPKDIALTQEAANKEAKAVLADLRVWLGEPEKIPAGAAERTHLRIQVITANLTEIRNWMLVEGVDKKVSQTVIDLLIAWQDYVDAEFCTGDEAWLSKPTPMTADDNSAWYQVFLKMDSLHKKLRVWMEHKGVKDA